MLHQFAKVQVGELGFPGRFFFAKVRVAGSNPVVRSKKVLVTPVLDLRMGPSKGGRHHIRTTFFGVLYLWDR